jgi:putative ABC transport system permease protein
MGVGPGSVPSAILNLDRIRSVPFVVAASLGLLVALSLGHQLLQSLRRRRRDVAILRALGADRRWIAAALHAQASAIVLATLVLALPIGIVLGRAVFRAFIDRVGARNDVLLSPAWLVGTVAVLLALANALGALAARRARRMPPSRYLASE